MTLKADVDEAIEGVTSGWTVSKAQVNSTRVPDEEKLAGTNASKVRATYLYTDLIDSSGLMAAASDEVVASVMAAFLKAAVRIIRSHDGHIRSFDGDRVMGIFTGEKRYGRAVSAALEINYMVIKLLDPRIKTEFESIRNSGWSLRQMTGIASGEALMVKVGIRNSSDILSAGVAPNLAAKLSDLRLNSSQFIAIGKGTYGELEDSERVKGGANKWTGPYKLSMGGKVYGYYTSTYWRRI